MIQIRKILYWQLENRDQVCLSAQDITHQSIRDSICLYSYYLLDKETLGACSFISIFLLNLTNKNYINEWTIHSSIKAWQSAVFVLKTEYIKYIEVARLSWGNNLIFHWRKNTIFHEHFIIMIIRKTICLLNTIFYTIQRVLYKVVAFNFVLKFIMFLFWCSIHAI